MIIQCISTLEKQKERSGMDNPEKLATLGTQDTKQRQTKQKTQHDSICVGYHYAQTNTDNISNSIIRRTRFQYRRHENFC